MSLFNRYDAYLKDLEFALWEGNNKYCNPKDYFVTEEECRKYLEDLKNGQELNREWNKKHRNRWIWFIISLGLFFTFCLPSLVLFMFNCMCPILYINLQINNCPKLYIISFINIFKFLIIIIVCKHIYISNLRFITRYNIIRYRLNFI